MEPETRDALSMLGERPEGEYARPPPLASSGGKEVWRRGCAELLEVMDMVDCLRRFWEGVEDGSPGRLRAREAKGEL